MDYMIMDTAGNAVGAYSDEWDALMALVLMAREDHDAVVQLAVLAFDDDGEAVGEPVTVADLVPELAMRLSVDGLGWWARNPLTYVFRGQARLGASWSPNTEGAKPVGAH